MMGVVLLKSNSMETGNVASHSLKACCSTTYIIFRNCKLNDYKRAPELVFGLNADEFLIENLSSE